MDNQPPFGMEGFPTFEKLNPPPWAAPPPDAQQIALTYEDLSAMSHDSMDKQLDTSDWDALGLELDEKWWKDENRLPSWGKIKWLQVNEIPSPCSLVAWTAAIYSTYEEWESIRSEFLNYSTIQYKTFSFTEGMLTKERFDYTGKVKSRLKKWIKLSRQKKDEIFATRKKVVEIDEYLNSLFKRRDACHSDKEKSESKQAGYKHRWRYHGDSYIFTMLWNKAGLTEWARREIEKVPYNMFALAAYWHMEAVNNSGGLF